MKLTNPNDDDLNAAFAVHVAGWNLGHYGHDGKASRPYTSGFGWIDPSGKHSKDGPPRFTKSADAVLPWLEKLVQRCAFNDHTVTITGENYYIDGPGGTLAKATTLAKAAVIALLRAHGVEVEFTKA